MDIVQLMCLLAFLKLKGGRRCLGEQKVLIRVRAGTYAPREAIEIGRHVQTVL